MVIDFGAFRVAEVEAVGQGQRLRADTGQVAANLGYRDLAAPVGVEAAVAAVAVNAQGDGFAGSLNPQHGGVTAGAGYGIGLHLVVITAIDARFAGDVGGCQQVQQDLGWAVHRQRDGG